MMILISVRIEMNSWKNKFSLTQFLKIHHHINIGMGTLSCHLLHESVHSSQELVRKWRKMIHMKNHKNIQMLKFLLP